MSALIVDNVVKDYHQGGHNVPALRGVSLRADAGQFLAIMGASGSGKSTLMHLIGALTLPDRGKVLVDGQDLSELSDKKLTLFRRRRIGLIFQAFNLVPTLSARENIELPLLLEHRNGQASTETVNSIVSRLNLSHRIDHRPDALSGGEQQRVAIGRALVNDPALLLADEPTGNLDSANSKAVCELLQTLWRENGKTVVMVTHEPSVAAYASQIAVLRDGLLVGQFSTAGMSADQIAQRYHEAIQPTVATKL